MLHNVSNAPSVPSQNRAITVLKRDLEREQNRIKAAEAEAAARAAAAAAPPPTESPLITPAQTDEPDPATLSPTTPASGKGPTLPARRQSAISLSSLHRPPFPHKLDLSSASLRLNPDDPLLQPGIASPVTLAPKSSISKVPPDFPFGPSQDVDIDLTLGDDVVPFAASSVVDSSLGNSADKPIELDLDIFGDDPHSGAGIAATLGHTEPVPKQEEMDLSLFPELQSSADNDAAKTDVALLAAAQVIPPTEMSSASNPAEPQSQNNDPSSIMGQPSVAILDALHAASGVRSTDTSDSTMVPSSDSYAFNLDFLEDPAVMEMQMQDLFGISSESVPQS
jgi:hypothetical protein